MINILPNQTFALDPMVESRDSGWIISGDTAVHSACNAGYINSFSALGLVVGRTYTVTYEVLNYSSGSVYVLLGTAQGTPRTANGVYTENIVCTGFAGISFYSDGALAVNDNLNFFDTVTGQQPGITIAFYDADGIENKKWTSSYSFAPDLMIKFIDSFFTVKNGQLWIHNVNEVRNNFYGQQYVSQIQFYDNLNPTQQKLYYSMRVQANTPWFCPGNSDISILPVVGRSLGMSSRLKRGNFRNYQGSFFADFMRNYLDTRFTNPEVALFSGEPLRGRFMELTVTNDDTTEAILFEIDIKSSPSAITY